MRTDKNNKKVNNMARLKKELTRSFVSELRKDCKTLVSIAVEERDKNGKYLDYKEKAERKEFSTAYRKAKLNFNHLVDLGEERLATVVFGKNAFESVEFRCAEKEYIKIHPEAGGFFDRLKYYDYTEKKCSGVEVKKEKKKKPNLNMASKARNSRHKDRKIAITIIMALLAVIAFIVAVCKKGFKPVVKAVVGVACMLVTILVFNKAKKDMLYRIKNKFFGSNK